MESTIGIDISKDWFDVAVDGTTLQHRFPQSPKGMSDAQAWLAQRIGPGPWRVGLEATGSYGDALARALHQAGHTVIVCNPLLVHRYAQAMGQRTKTDRGDAFLIAQYCARHPERPTWTPPTPASQHLRALVQVRRTLQDQLQHWNNQVASAAGTTAAKAFAHHADRLRAVLTEQLKEVEQQMDACAKASEGLGSSLELLKTIPGLGLITAATLLAYVPFHRFEQSEQLVAFVGLCPREETSGRSVHRRHGIGGMGPAAVRRALFMPALAAQRHNPILRAYAQRLKARHKPGKVITVAVMRKLLVLAWALLRTGQPFSPEHTQAIAN